MRRKGWRQAEHARAVRRREASRSRRVQTLVRQILEKELNVGACGVMVEGMDRVAYACIVDDRLGLGQRRGSGGVQGGNCCLRPTAVAGRRILNGDSTT